MNEHDLTIHETYL
jgi:hypothetical protein